MPSARFQQEKLENTPKKRGSDLIGCYYLKGFYSPVEILQTASEFFKNSKEIAEAIRNTSESRFHLLFRHSTAIPLEFMSEFSSELQMALPKILLWIGVKCRFSRWSTVFAVWKGLAVPTTTTDFPLSSLYRWHFLRTVLMDLRFLKVS